MHIATDLRVLGHQLFGRDRRVEVRICLRCFHRGTWERYGAVRVCAFSTLSFSGLSILFDPSFFVGSRIAPRLPKRDAFIRGMSSFFLGPGIGTAYFVLVDVIDAHLPCGLTHASRAARSGPDASASGGGGVDREAEELRERKEAMLDLIVDEVRERREFLEEMQAAGKGHAYEHVRQEMKSRLVELERLSQT